MPSYKTFKLGGSPPPGFSSFNTMMVYNQTTGMASLPPREELQLPDNVHTHVDGTVPLRVARTFAHTSHRLHVWCTLRNANYRPRFKVAQQDVPIQMSKPQVADALETLALLVGVKNNVQVVITNTKVLDKLRAKFTSRQKRWPK